MRIITRAIMRLPETVQRRIGRGTAAEVDGYLLDPQVQVLLALQPLLGRPPLEAMTPEEVRRDMRASKRLIHAEEPAMADTRDGLADGVPVRIYRPRTARAGGPAVVYFHGGGAVVGDLDTHDSVCRFLADRIGALVVAVDYRLAPEHPFPAAPDDAVTAYRWVHQHAAELAVDRRRIAVAGDSFGGNLAAVVALEARDGAAPPPAVQLLIYPWVDMGLDHPSVHSLAEGYLLTRAGMHWFRDHYIAPADYDSPRASPLYADAGGLAPAVILTAGFDPLRDEGAAYAAHLREAGVWTSHVNYRGLIHGFASMFPLVDAARTALDSAAAQVRARLG